METNKTTLMSRFSRSMRLAMLTVGVLFGLEAAAQSINTYSFSASSGTFTPIASLGTPTATSLTATADDAISTAFNIGFSFTFGGTAYTQVMATSNGALLFGTGRTGSAANNLATTTATQRPGVAPLWDDLQCTSGVTYLVTGTAPNRVLTVEWLNMEWNWSSNVQTISFQVQLFESSNAIQCVYRSEAAAGAPNGSSGASIGLMGTTSTDFLSLTNSTASPGISTSTATNTIAAKPATGQIYTFAPPSCFNPGAPAGLTATGVTTSSATLNWSAGAFATSYNYEVRSSGACGSGASGLVASGTTAGTSVVVSGLSASTTYTYCIQSSCSGVSSFASGSFTTLCNSFTLPLTEGFNQSTRPNCWSEQFVTGSSALNYLTTSTNPTTNPFEGTNFVRWNSFSISSGNSTRLVSPALVSTGVSSVDVNFQWFNENSSTYTTLLEGVQVQWSLDGTTWTDAGAFIPRQDVSLAVGTGQWKAKTVTLPSGAGNQPTLYIGFRFDSRFGDNCSLDAVNVASTPQCPASNSVTASAITPFTATISWAAASGAVNYSYEVRTSGACGSGPVGLVTSGTTAGTSVNLTGLTDGTGYSVCVVTNCASNYSGAATTAFSTPLAPPANDDCLGATALACGGSVSGNNTAATDDVVPGSCGSTTSFYRGVWHTFTPTSTGTSTISLCGGASWDTYLRVYSGSCGSLTCVASNDDFCSVQSQVSFSATGGTTYYILVSGYGTASAGAYTLSSVVNPATVGSISGPSSPYCGVNTTYSVPSVSGLSYNWTVTNGTVVSGQGSASVVLNLSSGGNTITVTASDACGGSASASTTASCTPPPPCNDFAFTAPFSHSGNTCGAGDESSLRTGEDVIYEIVIPASGCYDFSLCGASPVWDTYIYLTSACPGIGGTPGGGTVIASNDDGCGGVGFSVINSVALTAGTYYLTVEPFSSGNCNAYTLNVTQSPAPSASAISYSPYLCGSNATFSVTSVTGVTYTWTVSSGTIISGQGTSSITVSGANSGTVSVVPSSACGTGSAVSTTFACTSPPSNDNCSAALPFTGASVAFSTVFASGTDITSCTFNDFNDVWFKWVAPTCGQVTFTTCNGASFDTHLSLFTSCNGTELACNDDFCSLQSSITANVTAGTVYYLRVAGYNGAQGTGTIFRTMTLPLSATISGSSVSCFGGNNGSASVTAVNGSGTYTYLWSNGATTSSISGLTAGTYTVTVSDGYGCSKAASYTVTQPAALGGSLVAQTYVGGYNISCAGNADGSIYANISGGTAPYNYAWSNGASTQLVSGLTAGSYTVNVTDANGCTFSASVTLTEPAPMANSYSASTYACGTNVSCNGATDGSINLTVTGGSGNYMFQWSNGATTEDLSGLGAGTYSVTATDQNGCSTSATVTLTQPAVLSTSLTTSAFSCGYGVSCFGASNGIVASSVSGGCAPYTYQWSNGGIGGTINGVAAGMYAVTVTDANGCQAFATAEITQPQPVTVSCSPNATVYYGWPASACATITASGIGGGCPPYSISWSNGATTASTTVCPTVSTDYTVTVTDANGCTATCVTRVCVIDVRCGQNLQKIEICHNPPGNAQTLCVAPSAVQNHLGHGDYLGACGSNLPCAAPLKMAGSQPAASMDVESVKMEAFPNPFQSSTALRFTVPTDDNVTLTVFSMDGRAVGTLYEGKAEAQKPVEVNFSASNNANGIYFAKLITSAGEVTTLKLVLMK